MTWMSDLGARYRRLVLPYALTMALVIFTASGFAGLIYQSIWSHYLKLFLGHAAYAQTLVLAIFMGGMAVGAWLASRWSPRWKDLLLAYALIEAAIGVASLVFHDLFVAATAFSFDRVIPELDPAFIHAFKWSLAAALILPQSILLGMTFPLMTGGVLRIHPERSGYAIAMLYFTNSLGAAVGVLASGFYLIEMAGLPGTLAAAASMNLAVAAAAMLLPRGAARAPAPAASVAAQAPVPHQRLLLAVAALTGLSSFMYEIGWIRMLALVLGSSTHAFELMLSAFILGIAFGGLWIRRRIDSSRDTMRLLGIVQVAMGLAALATLPVYASSFVFMQEVLRTVALTEQGYVGFNVASHAVCLAVMFPAAFCAGMTLPLITVSLMRSGAGERAIGQVYGANTLGAILGVMVAVHLAMPLLGVKGLIVAGALIDIALGAVLFAFVAGPRRVLWTGATAAVGCAAALVAVLGVQLNAHHMASGVYRHGVLADGSKDKIHFNHDGKTATVSLTSSGDTYSLRTNGKTDGAINLNPAGPRNGDEVTMTLLGALPQFYLPGAQRIGNVGFGTGMTSNVLLASRSIGFVDTVEIEPAIVEAARLMRGANTRAFADARHRIHYEDAKTYFSSQRERFDLIISEPSNPWVSGVSSLFTTEFYRDMRRYLREGGLLFQWIQIYELSPTLVATIMAALHENFSDYDVWVANTGDLVIVAVNGGAMPAIDPAPFDNPELRAELERVHIRGMDDLRLHRLGSRAAVAPYFLSFSVQPNSDFYPTLDLHAPAARFMKASAAEITGMLESPLPLLRLFDPKGQLIDATRITNADRPWWPRAAWVMQAVAVRNYLRHGEHRYLDEVSFALADDLILLRAVLVDCSIRVTPGSLRLKLGELSRYVSVHLPAKDAQDFWAFLSRSRCAARLPEVDKRWLRLHAAVASGKPDQMVRASQAILDAEPDLGGALLGQVLSANMAGHILAGHGGEATKSYLTHRGRLRLAGPAWQGTFRFLMGQADFGSMLAEPAADQK